MSFATGFFSTSSANLVENQRYIKEKRAKDRDFLMTYGVQAVTKAQEKVNNAVTVAMQLENYGVPKEEISYIVDTSGPLGLKAVYDEIRPVYDEGLLTPDNLAAMMKKSKDYKPPNMTYEDMIKRTFGLYKANAGDDPAENEKIGFLSALGLDSRAADTALSEEYIDGYTGRDIKRIMGTASPGLKAPVPVDFSRLPRVYSESAQATFARDAFSSMIEIAETALYNLAPSDTDYESLTRDKRLAHDELKRAIASKRYDLLLEYVPTIGSSLLDFDKKIRGGLSNNAFFTGKKGMADFFRNTATNIEVGSVGGEAERVAAADNITKAASIGPKVNVIHSAAFKNMLKIHPDLEGLIELENLRTFNNVAEAERADAIVYILDGRLKGNKNSTIYDFNNAVIKNTEAIEISPVALGGVKPDDITTIDTASIDLINAERNYAEGGVDPTVLNISSTLATADLIPVAGVSAINPDNTSGVKPDNTGVIALKKIAMALQQPIETLAENLEKPVTQVASVIEKPVEAISKSLTNYMEPLADAIKRGRNGTSQDVSLGDIFGEWFSNTYPNFSLPRNPLETVNYAAGAIRDEIKRDVPPVMPKAIELIPQEMPFTLLVYGALDTVMKEGRTFNDIEEAKRWVEEFLEKEEDFLIKSGLANEETGEYPNKATINEIARTLLKQSAILGGRG